MRVESDIDGSLPAAGSDFHGGRGKKGTLWVYQLLWLANPQGHTSTSCPANPRFNLPRSSSHHRPPSPLELASVRPPLHPLPSRLLAQGLPCPHYPPHPPPLLPPHRFQHPASPSRTAAPKRAQTNDRSPNAAPSPPSPRRHYAPSPPAPKSSFPLSRARRGSTLLLLQTWYPTTA